MVNNTNQKIAYNTLIMYARVVISVGFTLYTSRIILQRLGELDFGIFSLVGSIVAVIAFISAAFTLAAQVQITHALGLKDYVTITKLFNNSIILFLIFSSVLLFLIEIIGLYFLKNNYLIIPSNRLSEAIFAFHTIAISLFFSILVVPFTALLFAYENVLMISVFELVSIILKFIVALSIGFFSIDALIYYSTALMLISIFSLGLNFFYYKVKYSSSIPINFKYDKSITKKLLSFIGWTSFSTFAYIGKYEGSAILINSFFGPVVNASYGISNQVNGQLAFFSNSVYKASAPQIVKFFASNQMIELRELFNRTIKFSFFMFYLIVVPILINTEFVLSLWLGKLPSFTVVFCRLVLVNAIVEIVSSPLVLIIQASGKIKWYEIIYGIIHILNLPISFLLFKLGYTPEYIFFVSILISLIVLFFRLKVIDTLTQFNSFLFVKNAVLPIFFHEIGRAHV